MGQKKIQMSRYARIIECEKGAILYHSLFSKPLLVSKDVVAILKAFCNPRTIYDFVVEWKFSNLGILQTLQDNYLLVEVNLDERILLGERIEKHYKDLQSGSQLRRLDLGVSEVCNFACSHCVHFVSVGETRKSNLFMKWEVAKTAIDEYIAIIKKSELMESEIHFGTAEPLINWPVVKKALEYCRKTYSTIDHHFFIETNLSLLTQKIAETLREYSVRIVISLDGSKEANDAVRVTTRGEGTFDKIVEKCQLLLNIGYPLKGFTITITDGNFHLLDPSIIKWAHSMGIIEIDMDIDLVNPVNFSTDQCVEKILSLHKKCLKLGMKTTGTWKMPFLNLINGNPLEDSELPALCKSAKGQNIAVAPNGNLYICGHSSKDIGSLEKFDTLFQEESPFLQLIKSHLAGQNIMCIDCKIESQCAGQCQVTREVALSRKSDKVEHMCNFYRSITQVLLLEKLEKEFPKTIGNLIIKRPQPEP